ncbi:MULTISPECIES: DUF87 domain-containing protein [unclassified Roseitalea]|uniref:ATP-binding protein n=1 Tax=unclassified Roseitalea TaxID=2639107 RepID=UPI00273CF599|nr:MULTISPECIES: DUF87 domain-containing protein [unclassified Roseitalea]
MYRDTSPGPAQTSGTEGTDPRTLRRNRTQGHVIECDGTRAVISAVMPPDDSLSADYWAVGTLITIRSQSLRTVGMLYRIDTPDGDWSNDGPNRLHVHVELVGEIRDDAAGKPVFLGGLSAYPHLGAIAHRIRSDDLKAIFANTDKTAVSLGELSQNRDVPAMLSIDQLISRHFAVVGTTGVGKSTAVCLLVRKIVRTRPDLGILLLDPHNEFASAFPDISETISDTSLDLPFWIFRLEEFVEVLFRGRRPDPEEVDILRDMIPLAKQRFRGDASTTLRKPRRGQSLTADTPIPYRIADLLALIDERAGQLDQRDARAHLKALSARINSIVHDPRYHFMFANRAIVDNFADVLAHIYRVPANGRPVTIFQLNGLPSEVVNAVVSVLCRLAFDLSVWSNARVKTLVLCEEAHRYIPADPDAGFGPTRAAIARIAKEGRKYGVSLGIVTQRPSEVDATILSQCSTMLSMRLSNDADQEIMRKAISGASRSYIGFLPSLANREAISFGQAVTTPMRMMFEAVREAELPGNHLSTDTGGADEPVDLNAILKVMRDPGANEAADTAYELEEACAPIDDQRPSLPADGPAPARPAAEAGGREALFTYEGPLRRQSDQPEARNVRSGRRFTDPPAPDRTGPSGSSRELISRFRK